jgi:hypothetical protein
MSKIKNMPGVAWLVIGACVTALVLPSAAFASGALKFTGIEGASVSPSGGSTNTPVGVTTAGQLRVSEADPTNFYANFTTTGVAAGPISLANPPSGDALVVQTIHVSFSTQDAGPEFSATLTVDPAGCNNPGSGSVIDIVNSPTASAMIPLNYDPGFTVPSGAALCVSTANLTNISVYGYSVPAASAPKFQAPRH